MHTESWACLWWTWMQCITLRRLHRGARRCHIETRSVSTLTPVCSNVATFPRLLSQSMEFWAQKGGSCWSDWTATLPQSGGNPTPKHAGMYGVGSPSQWWEPPTTSSGVPGCQWVELECISTNGRVSPDSTYTNTDKRGPLKRKHPHKTKKWRLTCHNHSGLDQYTNKARLSTNNIARVSLVVLNTITY